MGGEESPNEIPWKNKAGAALDVLGVGALAFNAERLALLHGGDLR